MVSFALGKFELTLEDLFQVLEEPWTLVNNERSDLRRALARFAPVGQGFLDIERFRTAMRSLGEPLTDKEIDELIQLGLDNEGGKVEIERKTDRQRRLNCSHPVCSFMQVCSITCWARTSDRLRLFITNALA